MYEVKFLVFLIPLSSPNDILSILIGSIELRASFSNTQILRLAKPLDIINKQLNVIVNIMVQLTIWDIVIKTAWFIHSLIL